MVKFIIIVLCLLFFTVPSVAKGPGGTIAFLSTRSGDKDLWLMDVATRAVRPLTAGLSQDDFPSWKADGSLLAYSGGRGSKTDIWTMRPDGSEKTRLTFDKFNNEEPVFSPDGLTIAYISERSGAAQVWLMNADGTSQRQLTHLPVVRHGPRHPAFPDGNTLFVSFNAEGTIDIWEIDAKTGAVLRKWPGSTDRSDHTTDFSPDGAAVAFHHHYDLEDRSGVSAIFIAARDGSSERRLTTCSFNRECDEYFSFSPDGRWGVFHRNILPVKFGNPDPRFVDLFMVEVATGREVRLTEDSGPIMDAHPAWRP